MAERRFVVDVGVVVTVYAEDHADAEDEAESEVRRALQAAGSQTMRVKATPLGYRGR